MTPFRALALLTALIGCLFLATGDSVAQSAQPGAGAAAAGEPPVALKGLDAVALVAGRNEPGKAEFVVTHKGHRYRFASSGNRDTFTKTPERYAIQNESCLVVPGAPIDPDLFALHEGRVYGFATPDCVREFTGNPTAYVKSRP